MANVSGDRIADNRYVRYTQSIAGGQSIWQKVGELRYKLVNIFVCHTMLRKTARSKTIDTPGCHLQPADPTASRRLYGRKSLDY